MNTIKLYKWSAVVALSVGLGMILGYYMGREGSNTPAWIGGVLIFLGAIAMGMSISTRSQKNSFKSSRSREEEPNEQTEQQSNV